MYFDFGPIANKRCQITPLSRKVEFPTHNEKITYSNFLLREVIWHLLSFIDNGTKVEIPSEIKPPLIEYKGQLISKCLLVPLNLPKNQRNFFPGFLP